MLGHVGASGSQEGRELTLGRSSLIKGREKHCAQAASVGQGAGQGKALGTGALGGGVGHFWACGLVAKRRFPPGCFAIHQLVPASRWTGDN